MDRKMESMSVPKWNYKNILALVNINLFQVNMKAELTQFILLLHIPWILVFVIIKIMPLLNPSTSKPPPSLLHNAHFDYAVSSDK